MYDVISFLYFSFRYAYNPFTELSNYCAREPCGQGFSAFSATADESRGSGVCDSSGSGNSGSADVPDHSELRTNLSLPGKPRVSSRERRFSSSSCKGTLLFMSWLINGMKILSGEVRISCEVTSYMYNEL